MKTFLIIIGVILILVFGFIMYLYQNITYQPDYVQQMEEVDLIADEELATQAFARIKSELNENSTVFISAEDLNNLIKYGITREEDARFSESIKKIHSSINDNVVTVEAVINISTLADVKVSKNVQPFIDIISSRLAGGNIGGELYIAIEGQPYNKNGFLQFDGKPVIRVGDFSQDVVFDETDDEFEMDRLFLDDLKISDFEVVDDRIQIFR